MSNELYEKLDRQEKEIEALQAQIELCHDIVAAVAHIGVDFGAGCYEVETHHIEAARKLNDLTPTQSLAAHDAALWNEAADMCQKEADEFETDYMKIAATMCMQSMRQKANEVNDG